MKELEEITLRGDGGKEWTRQRKEYESTADLLELATYAAIYDNRDDLEMTKELYRTALYLAKVALLNVYRLNGVAWHEAVEDLEWWRDDLERITKGEHWKPRSDDDE